MKPDVMGSGKVLSASGDELHCLRRAADFAVWASAWDSLARECGSTSPFLDTDWVRHTWEGGGKPALLGLIASGDRLRAGFALCPQWELRSMVWTPARVVHPLAHLPCLFPNHAAALAAPDLPAGLLEAAIDHALIQLPWDAFLVSHLAPAGAAFAPAARNVARQRGWRARIAEWSPDAVIDFCDGPEVYWASRSGQMKRKLNAEERRLTERGRVEFSDLGEQGRSWPEAWELMETLYRRSWQHGGGESPFDAAWSATNRQALAPFYDRKQLVVYVLTFNDRPVAFDLWLGGNGIQYGLARGMDAEFRDAAVGVILARRGIAWAHARGCTAQNLGPAGDGPHLAYKRRWMNQSMSGDVTVISRPWSAYGAIERVLERPSARRWWQRLQLSARSRALARRLRRRP